MIQYLILIVTLYLIYHYGVKPYRQFHWYADTFEKMGYKVYRVKWNPLGGAIVKRSHDDLKNHGDVNHFWKNEAVGYDIIMSNVVNQPLIYLMNPDLLREFFTADKVYIYKKHEKIHGTFSTLGGRGVVFSEFGEWKKKRKTLNNVFTFDFIKGMIPMIAKETDDRLDIIEKSEKFPKCFVYHEIFSRTLGAITAKSFFGEEILEKKIGEKDISVFMAEHTKMLSIINRKFDIFIFGPKAIDLGYRK